MKTPKFIIAPILLLPFLLLPSCRNSEKKEARGFRLPEGNVELGKTAFIDLKCHQCHTVAGIDLPKSEAPSQISLELGGEVRKVKSYGELVTSITQPQHIVSPDYLAKLNKGEGAASPMPSYNDRMTVTQMANIVTFLHAQYTKAAPPGVNYPIYMP